MNMYPIVSIISFIFLIVVLIKFQNIRRRDNYKIYHGLKKELSGNINGAKNIYYSLIDENLDLAQDGVRKDALIRYSCCILKGHSTKEISEWVYKYFPKILELQNDVKKDEIIYDYMVLLYRSNNFEEIPTLAKNHLSIKENKSVKELVNISSQQIKSRINEIIDYTNKNIDNYNAYFDIIDKIRHNQNILKFYPLKYKSLKNLEPFMINRLLYEKDIDAKSLIKLFYYLINNEDFVKNDELQNNAAIIASRIVNDRVLDSKNYKDVISTFLTVIFNDNILLKSLTKTNWDDEFNIYIKNSSGFLNENYIPSEGLENISDILTDNCIDIEKTRKFLLQDFESSFLKTKEIIEDIYSDVVRFYEEEKSNYQIGLEGFFINVNRDRNLISFTPYFGVKYRLISNLFKDYLLSTISDQELNSALPYILKEYEFNENEDNIVKMDYLFGNLKGSNPFFNRAKAYMATLFICSKIRSGNFGFYNELSDNIKYALNYCLTDDIKKIESTIISVDQKLIVNIEEKIKFLSNLIKFIPRSENLKIQLSNLMSNNAIEKLNSEKITAETCMQILREAINIFSNNYHAKKNIVLIISYEAIKLGFDMKLSKIVIEIERLLDFELRLKLKTELLKIRGNSLQYKQTHFDFNDSNFNTLIFEIDRALRVL